MFQLSNKFWYDISFIGFMSSTICVYCFVHEFLFNSPHKKILFAFFLLSDFFIINANRTLLPAPEYTIRASGIPAAFYYNLMFIRIFLLFLFLSKYYLLCFADHKRLVENRVSGDPANATFAGLHV